VGPGVPQDRCLPHAPADAAGTARRGVGDALGGRGFRLGPPVLAGAPWPCSWPPGTGSWSGLNAPPSSTAAPPEKQSPVLEFPAWFHGSLSLNTTRPGLALCAGARLAPAGNPRCSTIARTPLTQTNTSKSNVLLSNCVKVHSRRPLLLRLLAGRCPKRHARLLHTCLDSRTASRAMVLPSAIVPPHMTSEVAPRPFLWFSPAPSSAFLPR
jgi:hypothetical protein